MQIENRKNLVRHILFECQNNNFLWDLRFINGNRRQIHPSRVGIQFIFISIIHFLQGSAVFKSVILGSWRKHESLGSGGERQPHHKRRVVSESDTLPAQDVFFPKQVISLTERENAWKCQLSVGR